MIGAVRKSSGMVLHRGCGLGSKARAETNTRQINRLIRPGSGTRTGRITNTTGVQSQGRSVAELGRISLPGRPSVWALYILCLFG